MIDLSPYIKIWQLTMDTLKKEEVVPVPSYESWFEPLKVVDFSNRRIYLAAPIEFVREWVDTTYKELLKRYLDKVSQGEVTDVKLVLLNSNGTYTPDNENENETETELSSQPAVAKIPKPISESMRHSALNPKYNFESFVVGNNNHFAHAAALAVAEKPGTVYSPLFFQGGVGLGKTHLMQAIANFVLENNLRAKVGYFSTETFVNEFLNSMSNKSTESFRSKYRNYDVILIDDIQFFSGKSACQEEFFHTYNALHNNGSQIILSSDRPPMEIKGLEERLVSRFSGGLTTEILPPDLETRIAILKNKAFMEEVYIADEEVFYYIANQVDSNIRVLEGSLNRIIAFAKINKVKIDRQLAEEALKNLIPENKSKPITLELIIQVTAQYFKVRVEDLKGSKRDNNIAFPRQVAMYLARELTDMTYSDIGKEFKRDHSTVMHGHDKIYNRIEIDPKNKKFIDDITKQIKKM
ncbi:MAG: chromosomal replication initiator protein DnaA [Clostridiales bacterium]